MFASGHAAATGSSLLFFAAMILEVILGLAVLSYAAHSFLTVVVDTAAGTDHVVWPDDAYTEWLWKPWYLAWLVAIWLTPAALALGAFRFAPFQVALVTLLVFWLAFPVGLLSSLSATTRWVVLRPVMVWYLLRHFPATAVFYLATELVLAAGAAVAYATLRAPDRMLLSPLPALAGAVVLFLYARLVGRLAWVINQRRLGQQEEVEEIAAEAEVQDPWGALSTPPRVEPEEEPPPPRKRRGKAEDPWAVPPPEEDPDYWKKGLPKDVQEAGGYDVLTEGRPAAPPAAPRPKPKRPPAVYGAEAVPPEKRDTAWIADEAPVKKERALIERAPEAPPPKWPMFSGVYSFLVYPATVGPLLTVALGLWLMGLVLRMMLSFIRL